MKYFIRNRSQIHQRFLKEWIDPGEKKDLEALFKNFSTSTIRQKAMFSEDDFDGFILFVKEAADENPGVWELTIPKISSTKEVTKAVKPKPKMDPVVKKIMGEIKSLPEERYKGIHLAYLPLTDKSKKIIDRYQDPAELRKAEKITAGLAGKEKLRAHITKRIKALQSQGKYASGSSI